MTLKKTKRLLSIAGGGIRGLIPLHYLALLERDLVNSGKYESIFDAFDFFAGTSVGSLIVGSIVYTDCRNISDLIEKYFNKENMSQIFYRSYIDKITGLLLDRPKYNGIFKTILIKEAVGKKQFCDHSGKHVLIPTYNISLQKAKFYKSYKLINPNLLENTITRASPLLTNTIINLPKLTCLLPRSESMMSLFLEEDDLINVADILDASSAAPCYFPSVSITNSDSINEYCIDGAIFANNPVDAAYADALQLYPNTDIKILSIGTGSSDYPKLGPESKQFGLLHWILKGSLIELLIGINQDISDYKVKSFAEALGHTYINVQESSVNVAIDDITQIDNMIVIAGEWYKKTSKEVLRDIFDI